MAPIVCERWTRLAAALLTVAALVPVLHDTLSHGAIGAAPDVALAAAGHESGAEEPDVCTICLAAKNASGLAAADRTAITPPLTKAARLRAAPLLAAGDVTGAASPRAPPSA